MTYLQITTRCNMRCAHCCFSCTRKGDDMSWEVFSRALCHVEEGGDVTLGGGEPTVHPLFRKFVREVLEEGLHVTVITNGKRKRDALWLYEMALDDERISAHLSQDRFHSPVDPEVVQAYKRGPLKAPRSRISLWDGLNYGGSDPIPQGRWGTTGPRQDDCVCSSWLIRPDGDVHLCGCTGSPVIGSVWNPTIQPEEAFSHVDCVKRLECYPYRFYVSGSTFYVDDLRGGTIGRFSRKLGELEGADGIVNPTAEGYAKLCEDHGIIIPEKYLEKMKALG